MFKKNINAANSRLLGGKDAKKLRADVAKHFPALTDEGAAALLPPKAGVTQTKLSNRAIVYGTEDGTPLFFDPTGHGDKLLPTIYALAIVPTLLSALYTHSEVSPKVLGGADLFLQGVIVPPGGITPPFLAGSPRALCVPGNPVPFAVGVMAVSATEAAREGMKGRGLTLLHSYGDLLWGLGPGTPPNEGFTPGRIFPIEDPAAAATAAAEAPPAEAEGVAAAGDAPEVASTAELAGLALEPSPEAATAASPPGSGVDMDALLEAAVLGGLQTLKTAELPIMTSDFYQRHMLPLRPEGVTFDFKASSKYKKLSKLLDRYEKDKVLTQKQIRKQDHISAVNRTHPAVTGWGGMPAVAVASGGSGAAAAAQPALQGVVVEELYRAPSSLRAVFGPAGLANKDALYSAGEVAAALSSYAAAQQLAVNGGAAIKLDHLLASGLWGKKEGPAEGEAVPTAPLTARFLSKLQLWHRVQRPGEAGAVLEVVRKGPLRPIAVLAERRNGRNVTAVSRVEGFGYAADELAADFQRRFKTSCSVSKLPGKVETDCEILMQGDLAAKVAGWVEAQGIDPKRFLEVNNKLSGKKK